jgi:integrase
VDGQASQRGPALSAKGQIPGLRSGLPDVNARRSAIIFVTHSFATGEIDVRTVQEWLGHESLATTQKYLEPSKETEKQLEEMKLPF